MLTTIFTLSDILNTHLTANQMFRLPTGTPYKSTVMTSVFLTEVK